MPLQFHVVLQVSRNHSCFSPSLLHMYACQQSRLQRGEQVHWKERKNEPQVLQNTRVFACVCVSARLLLFFTLYLMVSAHCQLRHRCQNCFFSPIRSNLQSKFFCRPENWLSKISLYVKSYHSADGDCFHISVRIMLHSAYCQSPDTYMYKWKDLSRDNHFNKSELQTSLSHSCFVTRGMFDNH